MPKATLEQWRMFKAVVDAGGFNQAAEQVHKSQSSIHHAVHKLEAALGLALFENAGRRVKLTPAGELMLRRASFLLDEAQKLEAVAASLQNGVESQLRIAVDIVFPSHILYSVLSQVSDKYPLLHVEVMETVLNGANDLLQQGKADIAISPFVYTNGFSEDLCQIEFVLVAHPGHPLHALERSLSLNDLKSHRQIVVRDSSPERKAESGWLGAEQRWTVSHIKTSIDIITQGLGYAWLPKALIESQLNQRTLLQLPLPGSNLRQVLLNLSFEDGDKLGPASREFIGLLRFEMMQTTGCHVTDTTDSD